MGWTAKELGRGWSLWVRGGIRGWFVKHCDHNERIEIPEEMITELVAVETRDRVITKLESMGTEELFHLNVDNPLFDGLCDGVEPSVLYATIRHLKKERNELEKEVQQLRNQVADLETRCEHWDWSQAEIKRLKHELHIREQEVICLRNSQSLELFAAKSEMKRLQTAASELKRLVAENCSGVTGLANAMVAPSVEWTAVTSKPEASGGDDE